MAQLSKIPEKHIEGYKKILDLTDDDFCSIIKAIESVGNIVFPNNLEKHILEKLKIFSKSDISSIIGPIISLTVFRENKQLSVDEITNDLLIIFKEKIEGFTTDKEEIIKIRLTKLLNLEPILCSSKSIDLLNEFENFFCSARVVTDIRPIFGTSVESTPLSNMIIHNLHIHYHYGDDKKGKEIFLALDNKDIQLLKKALIRAEKKDKTLRDMLTKSNIKLLNIEEIQ